MNKSYRTDYQAYLIKYEFVKNGIRSKNVIMEEPYTEQEFSVIYEKYKQNMPKTARNQILNYICYRQKKLKNLI